MGSIAAHHDVYDLHTTSTDSKTGICNANVYISKAQLVYRQKTPGSVLLIPGTGSHCASAVVRIAWQGVKSKFEALAMP
jgi:hypothetical protein